MRRAVIVIILMTLATVGPGGPAAGAARPGLTLTPTRGPQNSSVHYTGHGFCASSRCGPVTISFGNQVVVTGVVVPAGGDIQGDFDVPPAPAGQVVVTARQPDSGRTAISQFFVGPSLPATPAPTPSTHSAPPSPSSSSPRQSTTTPGTTEEPSTGEPASAGPPTGAPAVTAPSLSAPDSTDPPTESRATDASTSAVADTGTSDGGPSPWLPATIIVTVLLLAGGLVAWLRARRSGGGKTA